MVTESILHQDEDLLLFDNNTGKMLGTVFTLAGRDANGNPSYNDGTGTPVTLIQLQATFRSVNIRFEGIQRVFGMSIKDLFDEFKRWELQAPPAAIGSTYGDTARSLETDTLMQFMVSGWKKLIANPNMSVERAFALSSWHRPVFERIVGYMRPVQDKFNVESPTAISELLDKLGITDRKLDFQSENLEAAGLFKAIKEAYLESVFPGEEGIHTTEWKLLKGGWVWALEEMNTALVNGLPIDDYLGFAEIQSLWSGIESNVTFYVPEGVTTEVEDKVTASQTNLESIIRKYEAIHGEGSRNEILNYLKDYAAEFEWAKMDEALTVFGETGAFPGMWRPDDVLNFDRWLATKEEEAALLLSEEDRELRHQQIINSVMAIYESRYGPNGRKLAQLAIDEGVANATDGMLVSVGEIRTPDSSLATWVPSDVRDIFKLTGVAPDDYLGSITPGMTQEASAAMYRNLAIGTALTNIQSGNMASEVITQLKSIANTAIMQAPAPEGGERKFFLMQSAAQDQFRTYLAGNVPAGQYRNTAWEYFPQTWKDFPGQHELGASKGFEEHMAGLGPTFFARLTPKPERVSAPTRVRPPGGGRLPMR